MTSKGKVNNNQSKEPSKREKLSQIYEELESKGLKTKDANFVGSTRIAYFRGNN